MLKKRLASAIVAVIMVMSTCPVFQANAAEAWEWVDLPEGVTLDSYFYATGSSFSDGLAAVYKPDENKYGYIDKTGKIVIPLEFDGADDFSEGLARVYNSQDGKYGFIDKTGKLVIPYEFDDAEPFAEELARVNKGGIRGFIDKTGNMVIQLEEYAGYVDSFSEGLARVNSGDNWGFIDKTGELVIPLKYSSVNSFSEGLAIVWGGDSGNGFIDKTGQLVLPMEFKSAESFSEGLALMSKDDGSLIGEYFYIDKSGETVISLPKGYSYSSFSEGLALIQQHGDSKYGYMDTTGTIVIPAEFNHAEPFSEGLAIVRKNDKYGFIDKEGNTVIPFEFGSASKYVGLLVGGFSDGMIWVGKDGKEGLIRYLGNSGSTESNITPQQSASDGYIYDSLDPGLSISLPTEKLTGVTDEASAVEAIKSAANGMTDAQKQSPTGIDLVTLYAEEAVAQAASTQVSGSDIVIDQSSISTLQTTANEISTAAEQALAASGVTVQRNLNADVKFKTTNSASVKITIDPSAANTTADNVRVETPYYAVSLAADSIKENAGDSPLVITITENGSASALSAMPSGSVTTLSYPMMVSNNSDSRLTLLASTDTKTYNITFSKPMKENVKVSLPPASGNPTYQAVTNSKGDPVGGKYNPVTNALEAKVSTSDTYTVKENKKNFGDISGKSNEMQNAINVLASKGIINGTSATAFSPDSPITRAEIAALIVRTLSKYNANENGGFNDVARSDWYFGAVGSAKKHSIMNGTSAVTFAPRVNIPKDQIVCVAARVLRIEMKYKDPGNVSSVLSTYTDSSSLASWSLTDLALATRENLVVKRGDGKFNPSTTMTRGDAAIVLYRMFMKIW